MKRAKHNLSHYRMHTARMGELFPLTCVPVLPGDTFQHSTSCLIRVSPLNTPVMHPVVVRLHHWFVPNRVVWKEDENGGWEQFITGGPTGENAQTIPKVSTSITKNSLLHRLGAPLSNTARDYNVLAVRAFNSIYNTRYRDQDLIAERSRIDNTIPNIAWEKDYLTTARPFTSKGPGVTVPVGGTAPVKTSAADGDDLALVKTDGAKRGIVSPGSGQFTELGLGTSIPATDPNLYADLSNATGANINDFRAAFAIQRYQEARARYGSRFTEYLRYLGITPSDARLQEPEYLGGGSTRLNFSEVLQTAPGQPGSPGVGDLYGHGIAGVRSNAYRKFFEEHGHVLTLCSVRPKAIYTNGVCREFLKQNKEDFYQRELANLGQQEVFGREVHTDSQTATFGYQDRYDEYRRHPSQISGDFLDTLSSWHLGRSLDANVALNQTFVECKPSDRIYQVTEGDHLWIMSNHNIVARRMVTKRANPRIL